MDQSAKIQLAGQWFGHFEYGVGYAERLQGQQVLFSFIVDEYTLSQFTGKCVEYDGVGASADISNIRGFVDGNRISFIKEYPTDYFIDEEGNDVKLEPRDSVRLMYFGLFNHASGEFAGNWEIWLDEQDLGAGSFVDIVSGTWAMRRVADYDSQQTP